LLFDIHFLFDFSHATSASSRKTLWKGDRAMKRGFVLLLALVLSSVGMTGCACHKRRHLLPPLSPPIAYEHYYHLVPKDTSIEEMNKIFDRMKGWELPSDIGIPVPELNAYLLHFRRPLAEQPQMIKPPAPKPAKATPKKATPAKGTKKPQKSPAP
jgi:hypothetical protein